jgi:D-alanyl-lipoteichoic acid acyltransferase DltB (MBOAT superfamily)
MDLTGLPELVVVRLVLPMGISFYAFQTLSYTIDVYNGATKASDDFVDVALYVAFFPQLVAGPIMRSDDLLPQFRHVHQPNLDRILSGALLMGWGMVKKAYIADPVARVVNEVFGAPEGYSGLALLIAVYGFAVQIYCDFSAYSDIARGAGRCLGFEVMVNFDTPYLSTSLRDFWRRWHISLSSWLRDYLYIPLGGNRYGTVYTYRNLFLTMLLGGLWHGASWNFVIWGALHGGGLAIERALSLHSLGGRGRLAGFLRGVVVFHFVCLAWVFFRAETLPISVTVVTRIVTGAAGATVSWLPVAMLLALLVGSAWLRRRNHVLAWLETHPAAGRWTMYALVLLLASLFARQAAPDFIYFQF